MIENPSAAAGALTLSVVVWSPRAAAPPRHGAQREAAAEPVRPRDFTPTPGEADHRDAVCACKTRSCVGNLQAGFLHALESTRFDPEGDEQAYRAATRAAMRCYDALPEES